MCLACENHLEDRQLMANWRDAQPCTDALRAAMTERLQKTCASFEQTFEANIPADIRYSMPSVTGSSAPCNHIKMLSSC